MSYAAITRRRLPSHVARADTMPLGAVGDFSWGDFFTNVSQSAATGAAQAGVSALQQSILRAAAPKPVVATAPPAPAATSIPIYVWALGGMGLVLVLILAMRN